MKTITLTSKYTLLTVFLALAISMATISTTHAQVANQTYQTQNTTELIAYLRGIIAQLEAQLAFQQGRGVQTTATVSTYGFAPYQYGGGQVLGTQTSNYYYGQGYSNTGTTYYDPNVRYDIRVSAPDTSNEDDKEVTFETTIRFDGAPYVDVWFEYGPNGYLGEETREERVYSNGRSSVTYRKRVTDLEGREYDFGFVRAVAEAPNSTKKYSLLTSFETDESRSSRRDDDWPDVKTDRADDIEEDEAILEGEVDMNDFNNGLVFFVYGEDEDQVEDIEDDFDHYSEIDEDGDDLQKVRVDSDLDDDENYRLRVTGLDDNTDYYFQICVEFEDEDDDEVIVCGGVEDFETD